MSEHLPDEFDEFVQDCGEARAEPASLEQIKRRYPKVLTPGELLAVGNREREQKSEASDFERLILAEESVAQARIEGAIKGPVEFKKTATAEEPEHDDLLWALGHEIEDPEPPVIAGTPPNSGRVREPERSFAKVGGGSRGSFLDQPFDRVLQTVAERATGGAKGLALTLAAQYREEGGL